MVITIERLPSNGLPFINISINVSLCYLFSFTCMPIQIELRNSIFGNVLQCLSNSVKRTIQ